MARKNRPTLKQQFSDFINRVSPFDGNALIQKTEHNQVEEDLFDSLLNNTDTSDLINSPSAAIDLDFSANDLYRINSSGSGGTDFDITVNNLGTGQVARIHITKKNNDEFSFTNAVLGQISNLSQTGTILSFWVHNINGVLVAYADVNISKTNSTTDSSSDKLATAKAVSDLKTELSALIAAAGSLTVIEIGDWNMDSTSQVSFPHGVTDGATKIKTIEAIIRQDSDSTAFATCKIEQQMTSVGFPITQAPHGGVSFDDTDIFLTRVAGVAYDSNNYNETAYNRGWVTIGVEA